LGVEHELRNSGNQFLSSYSRDPACDFNRGAEPQPKHLPISVFLDGLSELFPWDSLGLLQSETLSFLEYSIADATTVLIARFQRLRDYTIDFATRAVWAQKGN